MRELNVIEASDVSGGIEVAFWLSILAGATGCSESNTIKNSALWGFCVGGIAGLPFMIVGAVITAPLGAAFGAIEGIVGYNIGSLFYTPPPVQPQVQAQS